MKSKQTKLKGDWKKIEKASDQSPSINWKDLEVRVKALGRRISDLEKKRLNILGKINEISEQIKERRKFLIEIRKSIKSNKASWLELGNSKETYSACLIGDDLECTKKKIINETKELMLKRTVLQDERSDLKALMYKISQQISEAVTTRSIIHFEEIADRNEVYIIVKYKTHIRRTLTIDTNEIAYSKIRGEWWRLGQDKNDDKKISPTTKRQRKKFRRLDKMVEDYKEKL